ncbi:GNAT family N-acetyltransferase [Salinarchaeum chitinilyticum]
MSGRIYPDEPAGPFPGPPREVEDAEGREIVYEVADDADPEPIVEMYVAFDPADRAQGIPPSQEERIRSWLGTLLEEGRNVLAWHDDAVVGHAVLMPDTDGWELAIFVNQPYQGAGIGTELIQTLLGYGAEAGIDHVWLTVERWNRPAIALYKSVGFEPSDAESFEMEMSLVLGDVEA